MNKIDCKVILCGPAIGKTYLAKHDDHFVDIDEARARYKYNLYNATTEELETGKLKRGKIVNEDSQEFAISLLKRTIEDGKVALISFHKQILKYIEDNNIDYCLVYTDYSMKDEMAKRMKDRGNPDSFVYEMTNDEAWDSFYKDNESDEKPKYKIKLKKGEYLSDIKDRFN